MLTHDNYPSAPLNSDVSGFSITRKIVPLVLSIPLLRPLPQAEHPTRTVTVY